MDRITQATGTKRWKIWAVLVCIAFGQLQAEGTGAASGDVAFFDAVSTQIEQQISHEKFPALDALYRDLYYAPIWVKASGLSPFGKALIQLVETDPTLTPELPVHTRLQQAQKALANTPKDANQSLKARVAQEISLARLYLAYARNRIYGAIDWQSFARKLEARSKRYKVKVGWKTYAPKASPVSVLNDALTDGNLSRAFAAADPIRFGYARLRQELIRYIRLARQEPWPALPKFGVLKPGQSHPRVIPAIRKRLKILGDLKECKAPMDSPKYDTCLADAVKRFQLRNGLKGSGVIGRQTRAALNVTPQQIVDALRLNMDRIKWLYRKEATTRIELNIPAFRLNFFNQNALVTTIRVVVGKPDHPTPVFHNRMQYIVVNPWWKIPESIVRHEMLPNLIRDPYHYEAQGKVVRTSWDETSPRVDPGTVDWSQYLGNDKPIPYYFMQVPSRHNALGKIKFMFPNDFSVYIHDTPSKKLFFRSQRAFSHGCMRIQKPRELLESLAEFNGNIDVDEVMKRLEGTEKETIVLHHPVPIDIVYLTAFIDPYGYLNFRKDIYRYDAEQRGPYRAAEAAKKRAKHRKTKEVVVIDGKRVKQHATDVNHSLVVAPQNGSKPTRVKRTGDGYKVIEIY